MIMCNRYLPAPLPHEHLISVLARWFDYKGSRDFLNTTRNLSDNVTTLSPATVWRPVYWDLSQQFIDTLGWKKIIREHTLAPYYSPFLKPQYKSMLLSGGEPLSQTRIQPVQQNLIRLAKPWRWCSCCASEDYELFGTTYWHSFHQLPSVLTCYKHNTVLRSHCPYCLFEYQHLRRHWLPPIDGHCRECGEQEEVVSGDFPQLFQWLESTSFELLRRGLEISNESLIGAMRQKLGPEELPNRLFGSQRKEVAQWQCEFEEWLPDSVIETFYTKGREGLFNNIGQVLRLSSIIYRDRMAPPLSVLLMLKYLGLDSLVTDSLD